MSPQWIKKWVICSLDESNCTWICRGEIRGKECDLIHILLMTKLPILLDKNGGIEPNQFGWDNEQVGEKMEYWDIGGFLSCKQYSYRAHLQTIIWKNI